MFSIYYQEMPPSEGATSQQEININDVKKTHHVFSIRCDTQHVILQVSAWNVIGQSERSKQWIVETRKSTTSEKFSPTCKLVITFLGCVCGGGGGGKGVGEGGRLRFITSFKLRAYIKMEVISDYQQS